MVKLLSGGISFGGESERHRCVCAKSRYILAKGNQGGMAS